MPEEVRANFADNHSFSVKDKPGIFTAVGGDHKLEQTVNLSAKCSDNVIGNCRKKQFVAQWDLIYHEMHCVTRLHRKITRVNDNTSEASVHHETSNAFTSKHEKQVLSCIDFIEDRGSPFAPECPTKLQNFVTKETMSDEIRTDLLNVPTTGKSVYAQFHQMRFVEKTVRLDMSICRIKPLAMLSNQIKKHTTQKQMVRQINITEKTIDIAHHRHVTPNELLTCDVVPSPMLFDVDGFMTRPEKSSLVRELETVLTQADWNYRHQHDSAFVVDVMALVRQLPLNGLKVFGDFLHLIDKNTSVYHSHGRCDYVFDIYTDAPSVKDQEHARRHTVRPVELSQIRPDSPLPDMDTFWPAQSNKMLLQQLIYQHVSTASKSKAHTTVLGQLSAQGDTWPCVSINDRTITPQTDLHYQLEEADLRLVLHVLNCTKSGYRKCVVLSNDTDVMVALLYHFAHMKAAGLDELWVKAGRGTTSRFTPLHVLHRKHGNNLCGVLPAVHSLTGCDATSKVGTKKTALKARPIELLQGFGIDPHPQTTVFVNAERFLVLAIKETTKLSTFTELRAFLYHQTKASSHQNLPPTSNSLLEHLKRAWFCTYQTIHLFSSVANIDPLDYGYQVEDGSLVPLTGCKLLNKQFTVTCNCTTCARVTCPCRQENVGCSPFCKCMKVHNCRCKNPN